MKNELNKRQTKKYKKELKKHLVNMAKKFPSISRIWSTKTNRGPKVERSN